MKRVILGVFLLILTFTSCQSNKNSNLEDGIFANIQTAYGEITIKLHHNATPITVANFVSLAEGNSPFVADSLKDKKFYDGLVFHRIMKDFMIQGGDPQGTGRGNPGYKFNDEFVDSLKHSGKGVLSMANSGPNTNGSQFFITHKATSWLNGKHTVFGNVVHGIETVDSIANTQVTGSKPKNDVVMNKVEIIRNGKEAKKFDAIQIMSDYFKNEKEAVAAFEKMKSDLIAEFKEQEAIAEVKDSGLLIIKKEDGNGEQPKFGQTVLVNYDGYLMESGTLFDSSNAETAEKFGILNPGKIAKGLYKSTPMPFSKDAPLPPGLKEGLLTMKVGDKVRLFVPPHLGYGDRNYGPIPAGSTLIFDLEITAIAEEEKVE